MIVCSRFPGDDYVDLMWRQHDAYSQALGIIIGEAVDRLRSAERIAGEPLAIGDAYRAGDRSYDHRDVQEPHDLTAAIWRAGNGLTQPPLPLAGLHIDALETQWLDWLRSRARGMSDDTARLWLVCAWGDDTAWEAAHEELAGALKAELKSRAEDLPTA